MSVSYDDLTGHTLGSYRIVDRLGKGGMATVYRATQPAIGRTVAIKVLPPQFLHDSTFLQRFEREVRLAAQLQHPRILPIYDYGEQDGLPYIVMAYVAGGTLADAIRYAGGGMPLDEAARLIGQMAEALDFAHEKGVVHRDFKPSNVLLDELDNTYLADFGIARAAESTAQLTGSGLLGTPPYMAPELGEAGTTSPQTDIYALGITLYQMLTGSLPYRATTPVSALLAHQTEPIPDIRRIRRDLPAEVQTVIEGAMAKSPADRYPTAGQVAADLQSALSGSPLSRTPPPAPPPVDPTLPNLTPWEPDAAQTITPTPPPPATYTPPPPPPSTPTPPPRQQPRKRRIAPLLIAGLGLAGVAIVGGVIAALLAMNGLTNGKQAATVDPAIAVDGVDTANSDANTLTDEPLAETTPMEEVPPSEDPSPLIEQAIRDFDREMRYILETGDRTRIESAARGKALEDRLNAADILETAGGCHWAYDHRGLEIINLGLIDDAHALAQALLDRDGTVFCGDVERSEYAFTGPYVGVYLVEQFDDGWYVIDYCPEPDCPPELLGE
jgi:serine/threonine protein kinase